MFLVLSLQMSESEATALERLSADFMARIGRQVLNHLCMIASFLASSFAMAELPSKAQTNLPPGSGQSMSMFRATHVIRSLCPIKLRQQRH